VCDGGDGASGGSVRGCGKSEQGWGENQKKIKNRWRLQARGLGIGRGDFHR